MAAVSVIADQPTIFATNVVAEPMLDQQAAISDKYTAAWRVSPIYPNRRHSAARQR